MSLLLIFLYLFHIGLSIILYEQGMPTYSILILISFSIITSIINLLWNIKKKNNDVNFISFYDEHSFLFRIGVLPIAGSFFNIIDLIKKSK